MTLPKAWLIFTTLTLVLAAQVLGPNVNIFFEKAEKYHVDPMTAVAIIKCESGGNPLAVHQNIDKRRSKDYGLWQINDSHTSEAALRGNDLMTVEGNLDYGFYLASREGFGKPWKATIACAGDVLNKAGSDTS